MEADTSIAMVEWQFEADMLVSQPVRLGVCNENEKKENQKEMQGKARMQGWHKMEWKACDKYKSL